MLTRSEETHVKTLLEEIKSELLKRGLRGLLGLTRHFSLRDDYENQLLTHEEFLQALYDYRFSIRELEANLIVRYFDPENTGEVNYMDLIHTLKGKLDPYRTQVVQEVFRKLVPQGEINAEQLISMYNPTQHPEAGKVDPQEIYEEFLGAFQMHHSFMGDPVTAETFSDFYSYVSTGIQKDAYFELAVKNCWLPTPKPKTKYPLVKAKSPEPMLQKFRGKIKARGLRGVVGLARQFHVMDDDCSGFLSFQEFAKSCRDFKLGFDDREILSIFEAIDTDQSGYIEYHELLKAVVGSLSLQRKNAVDQAWEKLARSRGCLDLNELKDSFHAYKHPYFRSGKKTQEEVMLDFIDTFEVHHRILTSSKEVTYEEFIEYYTCLSSTVESDDTFSEIVFGCWNLNPPSSNPNHKQQWLQDHHRAYLEGSLLSSAPFGTTPSFQGWSTSSKGYSNYGLEVPAAGIPVLNVAPKTTKTGEQIIASLREKIILRGRYAYINLKKQLLEYDENGTQVLELGEFAKALKDFRLKLDEEEVKAAFRYCDIDRSGGVSVEEIIKRLRGEMNRERKELVVNAFEHLDKDGDSKVYVETLKKEFNPNEHPDVKSGKCSSEEVYYDFLDSFESHHEVFTGNLKSKVVSDEEFIEYYSCVSATIQDERYFQQCLKSVWGVSRR